MSDFGQVTAILGTTGLAVAALSVADVVRRLRNLRDSTQRRADVAVVGQHRAIVAHLSIDLRYRDGRAMHLEVEPRNPEAAEQALKELEEA